MTREEYHRLWSTGHAREFAGRTTIVPDNVERLSEHEPCWMCGTARGLCRHRRPVG
jgi:hypothetical protein